MSDTKRVTIERAGGTSSVATEIIEGETIQQLARLAAPSLGLPEAGEYHVLVNGAPITGDLYKAIKDGDKLTLAAQTTGGQITASFGRSLVERSLVRE